MKCRTSVRRSLTLLFSIILCFCVTGHAAVVAPLAPSLVSPTDGAIVSEPFTISWTTVPDPSGIVAYNWQVSSSAAFTSVLLQSSTNGATQDTVSGLADGNYFWRVQAVNGAFVQGAWSQPSSFTINGAGSSAPSLGPPRGYSTFHPFEVMTFIWSAVPGAASYVLEYSTDPSFPVLSSGSFDNIPDTTFSFAIANPQGNYFARVFAVDANGVSSAPSNVITFSVFFNNPIAAPPSIVAPVNGPTLTLPVTLEWTHVVNPQPSGYEIQIARDSAFSSIEIDDPQLNGPTRTILSLTPGRKFWRVRSAQGDSSPTTAALTAWSATGTFTISSAPAVPVSVTLAKDPLYSGETTLVAVQLTAAVPAGGATINLNSSNAAVVPVPATITMPGNTAWMQFQLQAGQVTVPTPVTLTATLNAGSASAQFTLQPPSLKSLTISPSSISGGAQPQGIVMLNGQAPAGGAVVTLTSNSPSVSPPASVVVAAGDFSTSFAIASSAVAANTSATVTASYGGVSTQAQVTLTPQQPPVSITLSPTSTTGQGGSSFATVTIASPSSTDLILPIASSNPAVASVPNGVMIPAGSTTGGFNIFTNSVSAQTVVAISVSGGGVTKSANLTVNPTAPAPPPPTPTPGAPTLLSPAVDARAGQPITFDWSDVANATRYEIQIDDSSNFTAPLTFSQMVSVSQATVNGLPAQRLFWRVRAFNSAGVAGPFSASRRFTAGAASTPPPPTTASLSTVSVSPSSVVGGSTAQGTVTLTSAAPSGGALVSLSSANSSVAAVPASVTVAAGVSSVNFAVTSSTVTANTSVVITATYAGLSRTTTLTVTPASTSTGSLPAPALISPATDARFSPGASITFDWSDVSGAASYTIQIDDSDTFATPLTSVNTAASQFTTNTLPAIRMWWRVRANSASGTPGSWSAARRFEVKQ